MKYLLLLVLFSVTAAAQVGVPVGVIQSQSAPVGACANNPPGRQYLGTIYTCQSGTWAAVTGTATGTLTGVTAGTGITGGGTTGNVPVALLPASLTVIGGVKALDPTASNWIDSITTAGVPHASQPACTDLAGVAASCSVDATNGSNISSGTVAGTRLAAVNLAAAGNGGVTGNLPAAQVSGLATIATSGSASDLATGTLPNARIVALPNTNLANSSITINSSTVALGGSTTVSAVPPAQATATVLANISGSSAAPTAVTLPVSVDVATYSSTGQPIQAQYNSGLSGATNRTFTDKSSDTISILDYVNVNAAGYVATRLSAPLQNGSSGGTVTTVAGSPNVTCTPGCIFTAADVGHPIVILTENGTARFQSTILTFTDSTHVILSTNADVSSSGRFAYFGTDNTTGIDAWFAALKAKNKCGYIPSQAGWFFYQGSGLNTWQSPCIHGDLDTQSIIFLGVDKYLIDDNVFWMAADFRNFGTFGGAGFLRNRYTGQNVNAGPIRIENMFFRDWGAAAGSISSAISFNSSDLGYLDIGPGNFFEAQNSETSMGIAIAGPDTSFISGNTFIKARYFVKCGLGCQSLTIGGYTSPNDMLQYFASSGNDRADVWVVPHTISNINPWYFKGNRLGNENMSSGDVRVLAADTTASGGSTFFGETLPVTTASTGYVTNMTFDNKVVGSASGGNQPLLYTYTSNLINNQFSAMLDSNLPAYVIYVDPSVTVGNDYTSITNSFGPWYGLTTALSQSAVTGLGIQLSNVGWWGQTNGDMNGEMTFGDTLVTTPYTTGADASNFVNLLTQSINLAGIVGGGSRATITAPDGSSDAAELTMGVNGANNNFFLRFDSDPPIGVKCWFEFNAKQGSTSPLTDFIADISDRTGTPRFRQERITLTAAWQHYKIPFVLRAAPVGAPFNVQFESLPDALIGNTMDIANVRFYQASEPISGGQHIGIVDTENGGYCQGGSAIGVCTFSGAGVPSAVTGTKTALAANGSLWTRTDTPWTVYEKISGSWVIINNTATTGGQTITAAGAPLTLTRTGGGDTSIVMSGGSATGQIKANGFWDSTGATHWFTAAVGGATTPAYSGTGTATFAVQAGAGTGATAVCATSHTCTSFSGEVTLTSGSVGTPATGSQLIITTSITRANQPNCAVTVEGGTSFLGITHSATTTTITVSAGVALTFGTSYQVTYVCGGV